MSMIRIRRGSPPRELHDNIIELGKENATYERLSSETKTALKKSLLKSQGYLCAYCMCRVSYAEDAKLEHIEPQSVSLANGHPEKTVDFENMLAVCKGGEGSRRSGQTCDTHKGNQLISIDPTSQRDIDTISYSRGGTISSSDARFQRDLCVTLNLNSAQAHLPENRKNALYALYRDIERFNPRGSREKQAYALKRLKEIDHAERKPPFCGIMIWKLKQWAGQGR